MEALTAQLKALAQAKPVLMIFEDVHWLDPTSLEVLGRTVDQLRTFTVMLIVTYRPEFEPPWIGRPDVTALTLNRLGKREIAAMIVRVTGNKPLPASVREDIIERTDGIPLFVEEMTKEREVNRRDDDIWLVALQLNIRSLHSRVRTSDNLGHGITQSLCSNFCGEPSFLQCFWHGDSLNGDGIREDALSDKGEN
jgi:hypothetical protein